MVDSNEVICRICLNDSFESDLKYLNKQYIRNFPADQETFGKLITPCKCCGSIGFIHLGCLLLEVQYRKSSVCHLCLTTFRHVRKIQRNNSILSYARKNKVRTLLAIVYLIVIPILTTYWFVNKLRMSASINRYWNFTYQDYNMARRQQIANHHRQLHVSYSNLAVVGKTTNNNQNSNNNNDDANNDVSSNNNNYHYNNNNRANRPNSPHCNKNNNNRHNKPMKLMLRHAVPDRVINTHPLIYLIFAYHWDVLWINLANLLLIQLVISSISHYQEWAFHNRPIMQIELIDD